MLLLLACAAPDPTPAADLVGAAGPIGYAARVATAAIAGAPGVCADVRVPCVSTPCAVEVDVHVDARCPLPVAEDASGVIPVTGMVDADGTAVLAASFANVDAGGRALRVRDISLFTVTGSETGVTVAYALEDVRVGDAGDTGDTGDDGAGDTGAADAVDVSQTGFAVSVDDAGTPGDPTDDTFAIDGGGQVLHGTEVWQTAISDVRLAPSCRRNPVAGLAGLEDVSRATGGVTTFAFHDRCDGTVDVAASAGVGVGWSGRTVPFAMVE